MTIDCISPRAFTIQLEHDVQKNRGQVTSATITENNKSEKPIRIVDRFSQWIKSYGKKFNGLREERPARLSWDEYFWSFIGALLGIALLALLHYSLFEQRQLSFLVGSFGASAVIIFATPRSPLAQPRNLIGGHLIGAVCGCIVRITLDQYEHSISCALAVALSILVMQLTETLHPPGGATALLAVITRPLLPWGHFLFILMPTLTGACSMLFVALIVNNLALKRTYPSFWW